MERSLAWTIDRQGEVTCVALTGDITETSGLGELLGQLSGKVVLDLGQVGRVNSAGVREWVDFVTALSNDSTEVVLEHCSVAVVHQLNMIEDFRGSARVASVHAPYFCAKCRIERREIVNLDA